MKLLPEKTVERLSEYRRTLLKCLSDGKTYIFSHELAQLHSITAVQVRRDIMFIGFSSPHRKGYYIVDLVKLISEILDDNTVINVAVVGLGHYGKAITTYFSGKRPRLNIVAAFDSDLAKHGQTIAGIACFPMEQLREIVRNKLIRIAILTVPPQSATEVADQLISASIKGILNFTSIPLNLPSDVYLEEYDMITSIEKVAYFVKNAR